MESMQRWYEASQRRFSVRRYKDGPEEKQLEALAGMAELLRAHGVRIAIGRSEEVFRPIFLWYGKISGTNSFAAIIVQKDAEPEMAGYVGEAFVLECTAMGLGTCWLGASYHKQTALSAVELSEGERIACITPIGVPDEEYTARPRPLVRKADRTYGGAVRRTSRVAEAGNRMRAARTFCNEQPALALSCGGGGDSCGEHLKELWIWPVGLRDCHAAP